jgi:hypothetical protein
LKRVAAKHDPEHLASLQTLMVIHNKGGPTWKDWVTNLLHQPDWKGRSIKMGGVMHAVIQTKTFGHTAQASFGEEKVHYLFAEGEVGVCALCAVHAEAHVTVEVVIPKAVVLPQILSQKSARKLLVIVRSPFLNIVSVHLASKQIENVKRMTLTTRTLTQMLQKKFALKGSGKTRRNVLRRQLKGVTQSQHMRAS